MHLQPNAGDGSRYLDADRPHDDFDTDGHTYLDHHGHQRQFETLNHSEPDGNASLATTTGRGGLIRVRPSNSSSPHAKSSKE